MEEPIEATFANGSQHRIDTYVVTEVRIGSTYVATVSLLLCPIGDQVILGMPRFDTIKAEIDIGNKSLQFQPRFWAKSKGTLNHWHQFPLASPLELVKWNSKQKRTKDLKLEDSNKSKPKSSIPVAKKDRSGKYIALIKLGEVLGVLQGDAESFLQAGGSDDDVAEIEALIAQRNEARAAKDWPAADAARAALTAKGIVVEDKNGVTTWRRG